MNVVLDDAEEVDAAKKSRKSIGRILLKGDNISLICAAPVAAAAPETAAPVVAAAPATVAVA